MTVHPRRGCIMAGLPRGVGARLPRAPSRPASRLMRLAVLAVPLLLLHAACAGADRVVAPDDVRPRVLAPPAAPAAPSAVVGLPTGATRWVLEHASAGLTYTS